MPSTTHMSPLAIPTSITMVTESVQSRLLSTTVNHITQSSLSSTSQMLVPSPRLAAPQLRAVLAQSLATRSAVRSPVSLSSSSSPLSSTVGAKSAIAEKLATSVAGKSGDERNYLAYKVRY